MNISSWRCRRRGVLEMFQRIENRSEMRDNTVVYLRRSHDSEITASELANSDLRLLSKWDVVSKQQRIRCSEKWDHKLSLIVSSHVDQNKKVPVRHSE